MKYYYDESGNISCWLTSCRDSVIGSFSSVSSSSNTGLAEVDGSSSTFLSIFSEMWREKTYVWVIGGV